MKLALAAVLTVTSTAIAQKDFKEQSKPKDGTEIPVNPDVLTGKLDNGLTYYIQNNGKPEDKVELRLVVNAGSILESDNQVGLAHFMEHMNFNGTKNFQKNELVDYLQSIGVKFGADLNAYTSFDETVYILPIPSNDSEKLEKGFQILEDWAHNATLKEDAIDDERGVVLEEYRLGLGPDKRMMQEYLPKLMYGSKYAERLPIGTKENLENFDYEDIRRFYKEWYRPDLMAVVAVGDLDVETLKAKIEKHFGSIAKAKNPKERKSFKLPNHEETLISIATDKETPFSRVQVVYKDTFDAPKIETVTDYKEQLAKSLFSTMINNRLTELKDSKNPPFVFGFTYYGGTFARGKNAYQSIATTSETGQIKALRALLVENQRVKLHGFQEGEFERAKKSFLAQLEKRYNDRDKQNSSEMVNEFVNNFLEDEPIPGIEWEYKTVKKVLPTIKLKEVNELINQFIHKDNRVIILTGPEKEGLKKVTEENVLNVLKQVESSSIEPYFDEQVRKNLVENVKPAGSIVKTEKNETLGTTTFTLSNGATVTYKPTDFKNDEVLFEAFSFGGTSLYSDAEYKATAFANPGLPEAGIGGLTKTNLTKLMSGKIASVKPYIRNLTEGLSGQAAPKDLETLFQMTYLYFTDLNKNKDSYNSFVLKQKGFLANLMSNPQFYFSDKLGEYKNKGNDRYLGFPTVEKLDNSDYDLAYKKYQQRFADAGDFHFYFVGNVDEDKLKEFSKKYIASLPTTNSNESFKVDDFREEDSFRKKVINKGTDPKSLVSISWIENDVTYSPEKEMQIKALGEILSIKLIEKLREEEGGVYGAGARGNFKKIPYDETTFTITFPCGPENVDKLIKATLAEVEKIKTEGPTDKDLAKVKETYLLEHKESLKENKYWLSSMITAAVENRDALNLVDYGKAINALNEKDIQKMANDILDKNYLLGILMPEEQQ
tara:strand:+ start:233 stop:3061 length:2829 start_codon:yes stop_codon:yes gene_type:complete